MNGTIINLIILIPMVLFGLYEIVKRSTPSEYSKKNHSNFSNNQKQTPKKQ